MQAKDHDLKHLTPAIDSTVLSLVNKSSIQHIAEEVSFWLQRVIIIEDRFFRLIGKAPLDMVDSASSKPQLNDPLIQKYVQKVQAEKAPIVMPPLPQYGVRQSRIVFPIMTGDSIHGFLQVFDKNDPPALSDIEKNYLEKVLTALTIKIMTEEAANQVQETIVNSLYRKLLTRQYTDPKIIQEAAGLLGLDLFIPTRLMLARIEGLGTNQERLKALKSFMLELGPDTTVIDLHENVFLIVMPESHQRRKKAAIMSLAHQLLDNFKKYDPEIMIHIALGRKCLQPSDYPKSYLEALKALDYLRECSPENQVLSYDSLGVIGLVTLTEDVEQLLSFSQRTLGPLLENDAQNPSMKLVQTLDCFLKNNAQIKQTAKELFIHVNTLRYRLEKIREIGGFDLDNAEVKFQLFLALKILNLKETLARQG